MLNITIFYNPDQFNAFAASRTNPDGTSAFYVIKWVVYYNPATRSTEYHVMHTIDARERAGMHMRKGVGQ